MESFRIEGGKKLRGKVRVRGAKNAATPILAATLLTDKPCVIDNMPLIEDVHTMLDIMRSMGSTVEWIGKRTVRVTNRLCNPDAVDPLLVKKIRSSILLLGPLSARFPRFKLYHPGGCVIGARPVGTHFDALERMGVSIRQNGKEYVVNSSNKKNADIVLREFSVTATENAMMLAAAVSGKTTIRIAACEPHVEDLGRFLVKMGARIEGLGTHTITIWGRKNLHGAEHTLIPDTNEAATFLVLGVATGSRITVSGARSEHLQLVLEKLSEFGARFECSKDAVTVIPARRLCAVEKIDARIYPGIPTDTQALFGVLATQADGDTLIFDTIFEGRFNYAGELEKMGAKIEVLNRREVIVKGPTPLRGTVITSFDLRAGASLIIAALVAKGTTLIHDIYQVDRGYERIEERLKLLGASIERVEDGDDTK
jgi:UDP-N-acetylglucosamine 1-carboxyvinyltransferase